MREGKQGLWGRKMLSLPPLAVTGSSCFTAFPCHSSEYMFYSRVPDEGSRGSGTCGTLAGAAAEPRFTPSGLP